MKEMSTRERFHAVMNFKPYDRLPVVEWAEWWDETIGRWHNEKLPAEITDRYDICSHFSLDIYKQDWIDATIDGFPQPEYHGAPIIRSEEDYNDIKKYLYPYPVIDVEKWEKWAEEQHSGEVVLWFTIDGFFWFPRTLLGIEPHLYAFYENPDIIKRINDDLLEWQLKVLNEITAICRPDFMTFAEDMSYNKGPMLSEELFNEFIKPYYNIIIPEIKKNDIIPIVDSDGDITLPAKWFSDAGLEGILPLERQAGVDISSLRKLYPEMKFIGHFDKMVMNKGEKAIRREFERLIRTAASGGYIIGCDHQTPPGVSYDEYCLYLSLFNEYAQKAGELSRQLS